VSALRTTEPLRRELAAALPERPFTVTFWDGSELPGTNGGGPALHVRSPAAIAHALRAPGQLGLGRAYVSGAIEVDDIDEAMAAILKYKAPPIDRATQLRLAVAAARAMGPVKPPPVPETELRPRGRRHSVERDKRAVTHHYDVSNDFFALWLDTSMTYSCAFFSRDGSSLEAAQTAKLDLICTKLALEKGERMLDVGCGWGSLAIHAAREHGVSVTGITLSEPQARLARQRAQEAGVSGRVDIRVMDYRELAGEPYDKIASIGMVEHVGSVQIDEYAQTLARLLRPGGQLLNHGIARLRVGEPEAGPFSERYVFPDAAPLHLSRIQTAIERAGLHTRHVEDFPGDYARTLLEWQNRFEANLDRARELGGDERVRVWRIYLRVSRQGFESGFMSPYQVRAEKPHT
jgi:cyclopropane-fatty-acyl-phospholipid synthase